jgi:hypothetical protein
MHFMTIFDSALSLFLSHPGWGMVVLMGPWLPILIISGKIKNERISHILNRLSIILVIAGMFLVFVFLALINPLLIGAGYVISVDNLCANSTTAFAIDRLRVPDPEGQSSETFRLHGFSFDNHTPIFRKLYRHPITFIGRREGTIWIERDSERWEGISAKTGDVQFTVDAKTAKERRPELAVGVEGMHMDVSRFLVTVYAKDGQTWTYDPETFEQKEQKRAGPPDDWQVCEEEVPTAGLRLTSEPRAALLRSNGQTVLPNRTFLHGTILAANSTQQLALVRSYTTTDEDKVILSAVHIGERPSLAWEKQEEALADQSILERSYPLLSHALFRKQTVIIFIGNSVVELDAATGTELRRTRW